MEFPSWNEYFQSSTDIAIPDSNDKFRIYQISSANLPIENYPLFILHHGGGYTSQSFAILAKLLSQNNPQSNILAFDCRGHGNSTSENEYDLSLTTLSQDLINIVNLVFPILPKEIILCGHSLGGAVVTHVAANRMLKNVLGIVVLDVVEGTAIESLPFMLQILKTRPNSFKSIHAAITWLQRSGTVKNKEAIRISLPSQLIQQNDSLGKFSLVWRTDLSKSEPHWEGKCWFTGMSDKFLKVPCGRLLILAGTERLDNQLTIGQMQGKFQMLIFPESGHVIQEDAPDKLALALIEFWKRNQPLVIKRFPIPSLNK